MTEYATAKPIRLNQPDTPFRLQVRDDLDDSIVDLTSQTALAIVFRSPNYPAVVDLVEAATISTKAGQTDPTLGWIEFIDGDPATVPILEGDWRMWGRYTIGTDGPFPSTIVKFAVAAEGADT